MRSWKLVLALAAAVLAAGLAALGLRATGVLDGATFSHLRSRLAGTEPIGIWQADPIYGWAHRPFASGRHRLPPDFDVRYHIDSDGHRLTPGSISGPQLLVLGCSLSFGYGVADDQAYPALLQEAFPELRVVNAGVMAWGTAHAWLKLDEVLESRREVRLVVYGFIDHHRQRNWRRRSWLETLRAKHDFRNPLLAVDGERVGWTRLADPERDGLEDTPELAEAESQVTRRLIEDMAARCARSGIPFLMVYLPDGTDFSQPHSLQPTFARLAASGAFVDLRPRVDLARARFAHDVHLSPEGHRMVAEELVPLIRALLR